MFVINEMPPQVDKGLLDLLVQCETATIGHLRHWGYMDRDIRAVTPEKRVVGTAVTIALPGQDSALLHHLTGMLRPGDFLVVDRLGDSRHACFGGTVALATKVAGVSGAAIDGPCADFSQIREFDMPVWCRGPAPITTRAYANGGAINVPVACGGAAVLPGYAVLADEGGVLVMPPEDVRFYAEWAIAKQNGEPATFAKVRGGARLGDLSGATKKIEAALAAQKK
ncbi:MAG: RraA family protein [Proteobacteria bacterium]|nr:RraA family protein [Pseudomonadota bacterium]